MKRHPNPGWLLVLLASLSACERTTPPAADQAIRPAKLFQVAIQDNAVTHQLVGRVDAAQTIDMSFEVAGTLLSLPLREGQSAPRGTLIAALDNTDFQLAVREAEVQVRLTAQDLRRKEALLRDRGISESVVDDARARYELSRVRAAQAKERLAKTRISAPFDGVVSSRYVDNRTRVGVGERIVRLADLNTLKVLVAFPETLMAQLALGRAGPASNKATSTTPTITAEFGVLPGEQFPLTFAENTGEANDVAQTFTVSFVMPRPPEHNLLPGMTATVRIQSPTNSRPSPLAIPTSALQSDAGGDFFVWLFDPDTQQVNRRPIQVADLRGGGIGVTSGLVVGDIVIAAGASQLQDGMRVRRLGDLQTQL